MTTPTPAPQPSAPQPAAQPTAVTFVYPPWHLRPWAPLALAAATAGVLLLLLNIPGVLRYPAPLATGTSSTDGAAAASQERNKALREQIEQARRLLERNVCIQDGQLFERPPASIIPGGTRGADGNPSTPTPGSQLPGGQASGAQTPGGQAAFRPIKPEDGGTMVPRAPEQTPIPRTSVPNFEGNLADLLDKSTVLVLAAPSGVGSGFFISPKHIVTNRHVVDSGAGQIYVASKLLGTVRPARLVAKSPAGSAGSPDYAVLEIDAGTTTPPIMQLSQTVGRLQRVTAAGFPGVVTQSDDKLEALKRGDRTAIPETVLTQGTVTVVQNKDAPQPLVAHEANISPGNSGGPLVDDCGRVVGVNTYGILDQSGRYRANYALGVAGLVAFLKANNIAFTANDGACAATVSPPAGSPPAATPATPPASAPPSAAGPAPAPPAAEPSAKQP